MSRYFIFILLFNGYTVFAQLSGLIYDADNGEPLAGAIILINNHPYAVSDSAGEFMLKTDTVPQEFKVLHLGYESASMRTKDRKGFIKIGLNASSENIVEVVISSALNKQPGVFMQSGTLNTNRLMIRGIGSRSPYTTNRVKAYFEGIPLTTGEGVTTLEDLDPESMGRIEIIRGPASGNNGAGLGGAINSVNLSIMILISAETTCREFLLQL